MLAEGGRMGVGRVGERESWMMEIEEERRRGRGREDWKGWNMKSGRGKERKKRLCERKYA